MTPDTRLNRVAAALPGAVRRRDEAGIAVLLGRVAGEAELTALVRILAACADPVRLEAAVRYRVPARLLDAHAEYERLRSAGLPRTGAVRAGERAYQAAAKRAQRSAARGRAAVPTHQRREAAA